MQFTDDESEGARTCGEDPDDGEQATLVVPDQAVVLALGHLHFPSLRRGGVEGVVAAVPDVTGLPGTLVGPDAGPRAIPAATMQIRAVCTVRGRQRRASHCNDLLLRVPPPRKSRAIPLTMVARNRGKSSAKPTPAAMPVFSRGAPGR
ncbi:hypothetical protein [Streptomyces sp. NPDC005407]|uniref:hypothetical protein n=1 Tax=Streptomyces sp. NPDC005407 TaxID=3155340 RepID=UPI0033B14C65